VLTYNNFDFDVGFGDFTTRIQLYTVPGQVFYNSTRKLVLKGVDGVVFVADSQEPMLDANIESLENLQENLAEQKLNLRKLPWVIQYNKRDLPGILPVSVLNRHLNFMDVPFYESIATSGEGVMDTLLGISSLTLRHLKKKAGEKIADDDDQLQLVKAELMRSFSSDDEEFQRVSVTKPVQQKPAPVVSKPEPKTPDRADLDDDSFDLDSLEADSESDVIQQKTTFVNQVDAKNTSPISTSDDVAVEVTSPESVTFTAGDYSGEGTIIDKDVTHKIRIPIKVIKPEDVSHVNLNLRLEIECILQTETVKKPVSKAEKLADRALEDFLLGKSKKRK